MNPCRNILVAYGTKAGSTAEIAAFIADALREAGAAVEVMPVERVRSLTPYCAVILGTATRVGKPLKNVTDFVQKFSRELAPLPVAYFVVGITMSEDTPERRIQAEAVLEPLCNVKQPIAKGLFAGKVDFKRLEQPWRFLMTHAREGAIAEGDWRDWNAIRAWVEQLEPALVGLAARPLEQV